MLTILQVGTCLWVRYGVLVRTYLRSPASVRQFREDQHAMTRGALSIARLGAILTATKLAGQRMLVESEFALGRETGFANVR